MSLLLYKLSKIINSTLSKSKLICTDSDIKGPFNSNSVFKLFLMLLLPIAICLIVLLIWLFVMIINKNWVKDIKRNLTISFISIVFILHPKLTESSINAFRCVKIDDHMYSARIDTDIDCYSGTHLKWCFLIAVPILATWVITLPIIGLVLLYRARKSKNTKMLETFLILYQGLKDDIFYWEFVNTLRKIFIAISFLFPINYKIGFAIIVMIVSERLERRLKPYKSDEHTNAYLLSTTAGITTLNAGYVYEQNENISHLNFLILLVIIVINTMFMLEWLYLCLKCFRQKSKIIGYAFSLVSKILCKKVKKTETEEEPEAIQQPKEQKKSRKKKIRKIRSKYKKKGSKMIRKKATEQAYYTTQRDLVYNPGSCSLSNNRENFSETY
ncbi:unnamed protein product [Moneuplotes crassus]|uniref:Uncharacterized protein n=1 Tax=Euplotes crassus TaxID=5936 RepID=A0AAD1UCM5_EUPCR|nr:unnamed protein product [Moneuplotes crassus]